MSSFTLSRIFVYGTLKRGEPNHYWLTEMRNGIAKFVSKGKTTKKYPLVVGTRYNIPFLLDKVGTGHEIQGEIYEVDEKMLHNLDILEDYPNYYDREIQDITADNGRTMPCWIYLIRNYPTHLLAKDFLESYKNTPEKPYCERSLRDAKIKAKDDLNF